MKMIAIRKDEWSEWTLLDDARLVLERGNYTYWSREEYATNGDAESANEIDEIEHTEEEGWPATWVTCIPEWVRHIQLSFEKGMHQTACGLLLSRRWMLLDKEHAQGCIDQGSRIVPCSRCCVSLGIEEETE